VRRVKVQGDYFHPQVPPGAVYIGRGAPGLKASPYANPHTAARSGCRLCGGQVHTREEAVRLYRAHLAAHPELVEQARRELAGKDVACWCAPGDACHGDVLVEAVQRPRGGDGPGGVPPGLRERVSSLAHAALTSAARYDLPGVEAAVTSLIEAGPAAVQAALRDWAAVFAEAATGSRQPGEGRFLAVTAINARTGEAVSIDEIGLPRECRDAFRLITTSVNQDAETSWAILRPYFTGGERGALVDLAVTVLELAGQAFRVLTARNN